VWVTSYRGLAPLAPTRRAVLSSVDRRGREVRIEAREGGHTFSSTLTVGSPEDALALAMALESVVGSEIEQLGSLTLAESPG
jgi:hypothetical protein